MAQIGMHDAKPNLSQLVQRAEAGEEIVITRNGTQAVRLTPIPRPNRMADVYGIYKDTPAVFADDFDELPDGRSRAFGMKP